MLRHIGKITVGILTVGIIIGVIYLLPNIPPRAVPQEESKVKSVAVLLVGDMFFDRYIRQMANTVGGDFIFSCMYPFLQEADLAVGNLEGPITSNASVSIGTKPENPLNFQFTFPPETASLLKRNNFEAVNIGNNHIGNFGMEGLVSTHTHLEEAGVGYFGGVLGDEPVFRIEKNGLPLSFVSYNQFGGKNAEDVARIIRDERTEGRSVIVYAHWGDEYSTSTSRLREIATAFANNGARAVIGSHPHIVLPSEYISDTLVYYSLGNFIFDQYFDENVTRGLTVLLHIPPELEKKVSVTEYPVILQTDGRTCLAEAKKP